ncbi:cytochrome c-type biogenesis protein CcmH [Conexibacter sp. S30A1]|uniref:cytochrome c-type biogenesis protein n=1 Tax=Conexibacter sp. S30A1 TaxID=2937800 RepID=UPI00200CCFB9|nr:cytochrome c-type biogenesis protein CcmH [Conexibacter sp. S30A1]
MIIRRLLAALVALALLGALAGGAVAATPGYTTALAQFMCVSCHEPLELVDSPQAISEQQYMRSLLAKGLDMAQVKAGMVAQYGPAVLAQPPASGFNLTVYVLPPVVFLGGVALLLFTLPKWRARSRRAAQLMLPVAEPLTGADAERLDAELDRFI